MTHARSHLEKLFEEALPSIGCRWSEKGYFTDWNGRCLIPQFEMRPYRVDYLLVDRQRRAYVIELDGHTFHERTPEQARRDRHRDRHMTRNGFRVLRFTAAEVFENPVAGYYEAVESLWLGKDMNGEVDGEGLEWWVAAMRIIGHEVGIIADHFHEWSSR